jgi:hypothetical protein
MSRAATIPVTTDDAELIRLGDELQKAWAHAKALEDDETGAFEQAFQACGAIVDQIERCRASTFAGLRAKALAVHWCHDGAEIIELSEPDHQTTNIRLAQTIIRDLLAAGVPARAGMTEAELPTATAEGQRHG